MLRLGVALASVVILVVPTAGGADGTEPPRLSFSLGASPMSEFAGSGLCLADANGGEGIRLTPPRARDDSPSWSPDGRRLAFHRAETSRGYERNWIYVRDERGHTGTVASEAHRARTGWRGGVADPDWSPDGQRVVYVSWAGYIPPPRYLVYTLVTARSDGSDRRTLVTDWNWNAVSDPQWSPNGNSIVFEHGRGISLVDAAGGGERVLVRDGFDPDWSPDGGSIVFSRRVGGNADLMLIRADGRTQRVLTNAPGEEVAPAWSPDGQWIAFEKRPHCGPACGGSLDGTDIALIRPDGSGEHVLRGSAFAELTPAWRPVGPGLPGRQRACVLRGSRGANTIRGSGLGDLIVAGRGRDVIYAGGGNDLIDPGKGRDRVFGGSGTDAAYLHERYDRARGVEIVYSPWP
jgi:Tol biopolymer transport system component